MTILNAARVRLPTGVHYFHRDGDLSPEQSRDQRSPAGLVTGAHAAAVVAVEILVEEDQVAPMGIVREPVVTAVTRAMAIFVGNEE